MFLKNSRRSWALLASAGSVALMAHPSFTLAAEVELEEIKLEEVIVTAEKRETNLQKTPQTVEVISSKALAEASITRVEDLQSLVPGISITNTANATGPGGLGSRNDITIRGVSGATGGDPSLQPSAATMFDGVYSQSVIAGAGALFDLGQVQLLKGPQGTLYGRNATTGVLIYTSQQPKFENSGQVNIDMGNYSKVTAGGVLNFALNDQWAVRVAGQSSKHDGYYSDGYSNENAAGARVKVLYKPNEDLSMLLTTDYSQEKGRGNGSTEIYAITGQPVRDPWGANLPTGNNVRDFGGLYGKGPAHDDSIYGFTPQVDWNIGSMTLTGIASYRRSITNEVTPTYGGNYNDSKERSLEVRLASNEAAARLKWQVGAYYYDQNIKGDTTTVCGVNQGASASDITSGGKPSQYNLSNLARNDQAAGGTPCFGVENNTVVQFSRGRDNDELNYALFTQETFSIVDRVRITGGARWQYEKAKRALVTDYNYDSSGNLTGSAESSRMRGEKDWKAVTWKVGVDADVADNSMAYFVVSTGWKAGTPMQYLAPFNEQKPEKLTAFSLGIKNRFLDERLQVNAEAFYWDYKDRQVSQTILCPQAQVKNPDGSNVGANGSGCIVIGFIPGVGPLSAVFVQNNAPKSHVQGVNVDVSFRPVRSDLLTASVEYLDEALYDEMGPSTGASGSKCFDGSRNDPSKSSYDPSAPTCTTANSPKWSATASWRHTFDLGDHGALDFDFRTRYESTKYLDTGVDTIPANSGGESLTQHGYHMSSAGLGYSPVQANWSVRAYVNNLEDKVVKTSSVASRNPTSATTTTATLQPPRTYGVQLRASF